MLGFLCRRVDEKCTVLRSCESEGKRRRPWGEGSSKDLIRSDSFLRLLLHSSSPFSLALAPVNFKSCKLAPSLKVKALFDITGDVALFRIIYYNKKRQGIYLLLTEYWAFHVLAFIYCCYCIFISLGISCVGLRFYIACNHVDMLIQEHQWTQTRNCNWMKLKETVYHSRKTKTDLSGWIRPAK